MAMILSFDTVNAHDREGLPVEHHDDTDGAVDEHGLEVPRGLCEGHRATRDRLGTARERSHRGSLRAAVGTDDDVGIEDREQRFEVALARRGEERVDDRALTPNVRVRIRELGALHAPPTAARRAAASRRASDR